MEVCPTYCSFGCNSNRVKDSQQVMRHKAEAQAPADRNRKGILRTCYFSAYMLYATHVAIPDSPFVAACLPPYLIMSLRLYFIISQFASAACYCYSRNGTVLLNPAFQPCNNATKYSACCMTNHSGAGDVGIANDVCMENGLCQNYAPFNNENEGEQVWGRQACTDSLWNSPYCLGDVCNEPKVYHYMLEVRMLLMR